jgi:hypothetical protein
VIDILEISQRRILLLAFEALVSKTWSYNSQAPVIGESSPPSSLVAKNTWDEEIGRKYLPWLLMSSPRTAMLLPHKYFPTK